LLELAEGEGYKVQVRKVHIDEVMSGQFVAAAACGTAVVITPIKSITYEGETVRFGDDSTPVHHDLIELYNKVRGIQTGEAVDKYGWMVEV
jgi:branched-chain amino acid aminotransferase